MSAQKIISYFANQAHLANEEWVLTILIGIVCLCVFMCYLSHAL